MREKRFLHPEIHFKIHSKLVLWSSRPSSVWNQQKSRKKKFIAQLLHLDSSPRGGRDDDHALAGANSEGGGPAGLNVKPLDLHLVNVDSIPTGPTHGEGRLQPHPGDVLTSTPNVRKSPRSGLNLEGGLAIPDFKTGPQ